MISLFRSFDLFFFPASNFICVLFLLFIWRVFQVNRKVNIVKKLLKLVNYFFLSIKSTLVRSMAAALLMSLILFIFLLNISSMFCFNFARTSQTRLVLSLRLIFWFPLIAFKIKTNLKGFLSHTIPEGTPIFLVSLLFIIEIIRSLIRPITLTVRLVANILAGHLLIILLSKLVFSITPIALIYACLNLVEIFVSFIQAYIFTTIICLYFSEID